MTKEPRNAQHFTLMAAIRAATPQALPEELVESCIDSGQERAMASEALFRRAFRGSLAAIPKNERTGGLSSVTGHIAESVAAVLLAELGLIPLEQMIAPFSAGHGIDLAFVTSTLDRIVVVEVKGTLRTGPWPRLTRSELEQFSPEWLDKPDNPGMADLGVTSSDVSGLVLMVHFARREWKCAVTGDFRAGSPVHAAAQIDALVCRD